MGFTRHVKLRHEKEGSVIFDTLREKVFVTNETGARIAQMLKEGTSEQEMVNALCEEFDADPGAIARDVECFVRMLEENDLIVEEES